MKTDTKELTDLIKSLNRLFNNKSITGTFLDASYLNGVIETLEEVKEDIIRENKEL